MRKLALWGLECAAFNGKNGSDGKQSGAERVWRLSGAFVD